MDLEASREGLEKAFVEFDVAPEHRQSITNYLSVLKQKDPATYEHSVRVGLLAARIGRHMHLDPKPLFFAGTLHDIGKALVPPEILTKTEGFNEKDMYVMRKHPQHTYELLSGVHDFSAEITLRHHKYQQNKYPGRLPKPRVQFGPNTRMMIDFFARILSLADFYDALSRVNDKFGEKRKLGHEEAKAIMLSNNADQRHLIVELYNNGIFGEDEYTAVDRQRQDALYDAVWKGWTGTRTPQETRRHVILACALEPLSEKQGCTTRARNKSLHLKLEYMITGAINIGDAFEELARRCAEKQPEVIYDLAHKAQLECKRNREGGRINQGIIEMLVPIVAAQSLHDRNYSLSIDDIIEKAVGVMKRTSPQDITKLIEMKRLANELCEYYDREVPTHPTAQNVYEYYQMDLAASAKPTSKRHNEEFVLGFPTIKEMYDLMRASKRKTLNQKIETAYLAARTGRHKDASAGITADCIACATYLLLSQNPKEKIVI